MSNKYLGSRLSTFSSEQLKTATRKVNQGEPPIPEPELPASAETPEPPAPEPPITPAITSAPPEIPEITGIPARPPGLVSIAGDIEKVSQRDWQNMETFTRNARQYKGLLTNDVAKLTADNHEFLKALKFTMGVDISQFVNNFIEQFRGRYKEELPGIFKR
jgi:hypothetical protein